MERRSLIIGSVRSSSSKGNGKDSISVKASSQTGGAGGYGDISSFSSALALSSEGGGSCSDCSNAGGSSMIFCDSMLA